MLNKQDKQCVVSPVSRRIWFRMILGAVSHVIAFPSKHMENRSCSLWSARAHDHAHWKQAALITPARAQTNTNESLAYAKGHIPIDTGGHAFAFTMVSHDLHRAIYASHAKRIMVTKCGILFTL